MNESIGGSLLLNLVIIIVGVMIAIFTASFAYTKAYRAKSIIIDEVQNHGIINTNDSEEITTLAHTIDEQLTNMGYRKEGKKCPTKEGKKLIYPMSNNEASYCIYEVEDIDNTGSTNIYYEIQTYMFFDIPLIKFNLPIKGQTISFRTEVKDTEDDL